MSGRPMHNRQLSTGGGTIRRGGTLSRGKTLSRPDRFQTPETMFKKRTEDEPASCWVICSRITTCWALPPFMRMCGLADKQVQQAWREKFTLCFIILLIGGMVAFLIVGFSLLLCPKDQRQGAQTYVRYGDGQAQGQYGIEGNIYDFTNGALYPPGFHMDDLTPAQDISNLFIHGRNAPNCANLNNAAATFDNCLAPGGCPANITPTADNLRNKYNLTPLGQKAGYDWNQLAMPELLNYIVIDGNVLNLDKYFAVHKNPVPGDEVDAVLRQVRDSGMPEGGRDATKMFFRRESLKNSASCLVQKFGAGFIDKATPGCFASDLFMFVSLTVVLGIVMSRFAMAIIFDWFLSARLAKPPPKSKVHNMASANSSGTTIVAPTSGKAMGRVASGASVSGANVQELHAVLLVTCYSEGESSLRTTIESLAATEYPDNKKLLFIICDGIITGSGNDRSTPEICSSLMELDPAFDSDPTPQSYIAVAAGSKQHNRAKVYAGYFRWKNRRVPTVLIVKCGNEEEHDKPKAGNRGKRDSQLILMNFFSRVTYNDRMTPLDYELFRKIQHLMQVTPDKFEIVLMVDADTKVYPSSVRLLMNCMNNDPLIMGLCGETKIANKRQSWVTAIQVFEYYISHHLGKGFESVFGGVTCLPGCFCMYRLKARKGDDWVPIITKPEIVQEYSQNIVETLHQKNLLLLGEDRFLTTLMLRNFPNRKMMFMPQAICKTVVPDEFSVLLSQRRRWINSTIHNLLELVLVRNLCGTFCFSMQFVILMELIGTVVLPIAMILSVVLIVNISLLPSISTLAQAAPLILLVFVLTMPAILILLTTRKLIYVAWMVVYLCALPVWNFILPLYAYWHFDDFSWGETRKVAGEAKGDAHGNADGMFESSKVPLKRWDDYEKARVRQAKRIERAERQRIHGSPYLRGSPSIYTDAGDSKSELTLGELGPQQYHYDYHGRQVLSPPLAGNSPRAMMQGPPGSGGPLPQRQPSQNQMNHHMSQQWSGPIPGNMRSPMPSPGWMPHQQQQQHPSQFQQQGPPPPPSTTGQPGFSGPIGSMAQGPLSPTMSHASQPPVNAGGMRRNRPDEEDPLNSGFP